MSVYVDDMRLPATVGRLGMRPEWLQDRDSHNFHFDVVDWRRDRAIDLGAIMVTTEELAEICMARRKTKP